MRPLYAVVVVSIGLAFVAAGCGRAIPSSNGGPATIKLTSFLSGPTYPRFLVDARGDSLCLFERDTRGESYCTRAAAGNCSRNQSRCSA
jgi:hypothetical protein